jgi:hypothetical protein
VPVSLAALALLLVGAGSPALAPAEPVTVVGAADQYEIFVEDPGHPGSTEQHGGAAGTRVPAATGPRCSYLPRDGTVRWRGHLEFDASDRTRGSWWYVLCDNGYADLRFLPNASLASPGPVPTTTITPEELARQAVDRLPLDRPDIRTAPPVGTPSLVNLPTLVWLPGTSWTERSRRVDAGAVWAEATVRPQVMTVEGTGVGRVTCKGHGEPYLPGKSSDCAVTFLAPGRYRLTVAVAWGGTWRGSGDTGGVLPTLETRSTVDVKVVEAHSVLVAD